MDRDATLVIGYGNSLRGDDGMGPEVARRLRQRGFETLETHQLLPEIAERIAAARAVFFADADAGLQPGEVSIEPLQEAATPASRPIGHYTAPAALMRMASAGYGARPDAWIVGMGGSSFEIGDGLSEAAWQAVSSAIEQVLQVAGGATTKHRSTVTESYESAISRPHIVTG
jgi:hydrogenase maturation protease